MKLQRLACSRSAGEFMFGGKSFEVFKNAINHKDFKFDEQKRKANWSGSGENPYEELPTLHLYTYRMSNMVEETKHADLNDDEFEYAYKLNKFFG